MDLNSLKVEIVNADAYPWLEKNRRKFDVVIDDIYLAGKIDVFRPQLMTEELLDHLRLAVAPGGLLATNLVTGAGHRSMQSQTRRCFQKGFPTVRSLRTCDSMNEVLVAGESVATGRRLPDFSKYFPDWRDRMYWDRIKVKSLS